MDSDTRAFQFIFIGNLLYMKGVMVLLDACSILKKNNIPYICHIIGAPTAELSLEDIQKQINQRQLADNIITHGPLYGNDKNNLLTKADAMVFPTLDDCFPLVVLEGMQHKLPVIASDEGAIPDMIVHGSTGFLLAKGNAESFAAAMQTLVNQPGMAEQMGADAYEYFISHFTQQAFMNKLCDILRAN